MTPAALLKSLTARGVVVALNGGGLFYDAPAGVLTDADLAALREHKPALLALLRERRYAPGDVVAVLDVDGRDLCAAVVVEDPGDGGIVHIRLWDGREQGRLPGGLRRVGLWPDEKARK